jgi:hypothetical protein
VSQGLLRLHGALSGAMNSRCHVPVLRRPESKGGVTGELEDLAAVGAHGVDEAAEEEVEQILQILSASRSAASEVLGERREPREIGKQQRGLSSLDDRLGWWLVQRNASPDERRHKRVESQNTGPSRSSPWEVGRHAILYTLENAAAGLIDA